jgi:hypothetical protein
MEDDSFISQLIQHDIIGLVETHLDKSKTVCFDGFSVYRKDRPKIKKATRSLGGIIVMIRNDIQKGITHLPCNNENFHWLKLKKNFFSLENDIYMCIAHIPPQNSSYTVRTGDVVLDAIVHDIEKYSQLGSIILTGDLNARTGDKADFIINDEAEHINLGIDYPPDTQLLTRGSQDSVISCRGNHVLDLCIEAKLRMLNGRTTGDCNGKFTCHNALGSSVVDYVIVSDVLYSQIAYFHVHNFDATLSDHCKTSFSIYANINHDAKTKGNTIELQDMPSRFCWSNQAASRYTQAMCNKETKAKLKNLNTNLSKGQTNIESEVELLHDIFISAARCSLMPKRIASKTNKRKRCKRWFNNDLKTLRQRVQASSRQLARDPYNPIIRGLHYRDLKHYNRIRKKTFRLYKADMLHKLEQLEENDPKQFWSLLDDLKNNPGKKQPSTNIPSSVWFDHFKNLNSPSESITKLQNQYKMMLENKPDIFNELCYEISSSEITDVIKSLKNGKGTRLDGISHEMIKVAHPFVLAPMTKLFNKILANSTYPKLWSTGYISPIFKANDPDNPVNYRGLTVKSCMGKLFNSVLNKRLTKFLETHKIINDSQIGFKKKARTADHIFVMKTLIDSYFNRGKKLYVCFIDFKQAFDRVARSCLLVKLYDIGVGGIFLNTLQDMFNNSQLQVRIGDKLTSSFKSEIGVGQGDPLSANLFNVLVNGIPAVFDNTCCPVNLGNREISCLLYADDVVLLSETEHGLQNSINLLHAHCDSIGLIINTSKSKIIVFSKSGRCTNHSFDLEGEILESVREYKYLGIIFTPSGSFTAAKEHLYKKSLKAHFKLKKALYGIDNHRLGIHLFEHTVSPILTYGAEVWGAFNPTTCNIDTMTFKDIYSQSKILNTQRKFARFLLGMPKQCPVDALHGELGWSPIYSKIITAVIKYWHRVANEDTSSLLGEALQTHTNLKSMEKSNFISVIELMLQKLHIRIPLSTLEKYSTCQLTNIIKSQVQITIQSEWKDAINKSANSKKSGSNKLRTYKLFKQQFKLEPYLCNVKNRAHRKSLCQLRTSTHPLRIEKGRHLNLKVSERICLCCPLQKVEDELHFLLECSLYNNERTIFLQKIFNKYPNVQSLPPDLQFIWLMSAEEGFICSEIAFFVHECLSKRKIQNMI